MKTLPVSREDNENAMRSNFVLIRMEEPAVGMVVWCQFLPKGKMESLGPSAGFFTDQASPRSA